MSHSPFNVLFLCTGNTARSVLAEGILRKEGGGQFNAFSAGSQPKGVVNPFAIKTLEAFGYPTDGYRSKSWDEYAGPKAPSMDFIFTVCDNAAGETCPIWPGHPMTAHWGVEDPAAVEGTDLEKERLSVIRPTPQLLFGQLTTGHYGPQNRQSMRFPIPVLSYVGFLDDRGDGIHFDIDHGRCRQPTEQLQGLAQFLVVKLRKQTWF